MTQVFSDGFETDDFSAWTGTSSSDGDTISVVSTAPHHDAYHLDAQTNASSQGESTYAYKTLASNYKTAYVRAYVQFKALPDGAGKISQFLCFRDHVAYDNRPIASVYNDAGTVKWRLEGTGATTTNAGTVSVDTYYCVEMAAHFANDGTGFYKLWINGSLLIDLTGLTNDYVASSLLVGVLSTGYSGAWAAQTYIDCVVVTDSYIGPEASATLHTVTDALSAAEVTLRHRTISLQDEAALAEDAERPIRQLSITDAVSVFEGTFADRVLQIMDGFTLVEVAEVGSGTPKKTRLFLVLGDFALQLAGD